MMVSYLNMRKIHKALTNSAREILEAREAEAAAKKLQVAEDEKSNGVKGGAVDTDPTDDNNDDRVSAARDYENEVEQREKHIIMQLRAAQDLEANEHPIKLKDGSTIKLKPSEVDVLLGKYETKNRPSEKEAFVNDISASPESIVNHL